MASEEGLKRLGEDQTVRRQEDHLNQELQPTDLRHKSAKEELRPTDLKHGSVEEELRETKEALKKEREARMKAEKERDEFESLLARHEGLVTPTKQGTCGSDDSPPTKLKKDNILAALSRDWKRPFRGDAVNLLRGLLLDEEEAFEKDKFYAKSITIIQSSGTGKSRLVDELGKEFLTISFALRRPTDDITWPPGDPEITDFLTCSTCYRELTARAVALLSGTLAQLTEWCNKKTQSDQTKEMAKTFHDEMAPIDPKSTETTSQTELRSLFRTNFIKDAVEAANQLYQELIYDSTWTNDHWDAVKMANHKLVQNHLIQPARNLTDCLNERYQVSGDTKAGATTFISSGGSQAAIKAAKPLLLFVFDEAANLWVTTNQERSGYPFYALRRVLGLLKDIPIWSFLLSTQSTTGSLLPPRDIDRSNRMRFGELSTLEPFLGLQLDVAAGEAVATREGLDKERRKPMSQFATVEHMTMFGRSLWRAYCNVAPLNLRCFALAKLIHNTKYDVGNKNHVFAALASRLCLDVRMKEAEAIALAHEAVNSYLRIIISIDTTEKGKDSSGDYASRSTTKDMDRSDSGLKEKINSAEPQSNSSNGGKSVKFELSKTGHQSQRSLQRMETVTPSEPIIAEAVAELLCKDQNWSSSINTLAKHLLSRGLVEKGLKGELFARLLCILARDFHLSGLKTTNDSFPYAKTFSVNDFLQSLFGNKRFQEFKEFTPPIPNTQSSESSETATFSDVFKKGSMNFTHFTNTDVLLQDKNMSHVLHLLLRQQQALQLAFAEPDFDILIPTYFGNVGEQFNPARASAVVISVKNRGAASHLPLGNNIYKMFSHTNDPILCILVDLGIKRNPRVHVQDLATKGSKQYLFGIHAEGAGVDTYGCLRGHELEDATRALLQQVLQTRDPRGVRDEHDKFCHRNKRSHYCNSWEQFYAA